MIIINNNNIQKCEKLSDTVVGETYRITLLLTGIVEGTAKNGNPFVTLKFMDGTTVADAKMFNSTKEQVEAMGISEVSVVDATLEVSNFAGKSYNVKDISPNTNPSLSVKDFIIHAPIDEHILFNRIVDILKHSHTDNGKGFQPLSDLAIGILEKFMDSFMTSSAAVLVHHNFLGGLIYHTYRMVKVADSITNIYDGLNKELVVCGAALHDLGKIIEYRTSELGEAETTDFGVLFGHLFCGALIVESMSSRFKCNPEEVRLLVHIILSHHGKGEYGAVVAPAIPEAFAVHHIDNLDAKITQCEAVYNEMEARTISEKRPFGMDNRLYKPNYL